MLQPGERIDEWVVEGPLGSGGTASVYRCHNGDTPAVAVAVKVLDDVALKRDDARARLAREGDLLSDLDHPNIVRVHDVKPAADPPYLVMALVEGEALSARMRAIGALEISAATALMLQLASAVAYLHERGIQHRDIKPANVIMDANGVPVLVDFGLALEAGASRLTAEGLRMGTVSYVPPEWAFPTKIDSVRWDVYSLGAVFWELLVGRRAFPLADDTDPMSAALLVMADKRGHPPLDPGPDAPFYLRVLIRQMTHPDAAERPRDATVVLAALQAGEDGVGDPIEMFETPMPTRANYGVEVSAPTLDRLASSGTPMSPESLEGGEATGWWHSFVWGALVGGAAVAVIFASAVGWFVGRNAALPEGEPVRLPPAAMPPPYQVPPDPVPARPAPGTPDAPPPGPAAAAPQPGSAVEAPPSSDATVVTGATFATWVAAHPSWQRDAAIAAGLADQGYLKGWDLSVPRAGPATRVSWYAAVAYCEGRGGLASVDAAPVRWQANGDHPSMELRVSDGKPAWRTSDGRQSTQLDPTQASLSAGFRCAN